MVKFPLAGSHVSSHSRLHLAIAVAILDNFELSTRKDMSAADTKHRPPSETSGTLRGNVVDHNEPHGKYRLASLYPCCVQASTEITHGLTKLFCSDR